MAKTVGTQAHGQPRRGWRGGALVVLAMVVLAAAAWNWSWFSARAVADAAYAARIACSCRYIAGRTLEDCGDGLGRAVGRVSLSEDAVEARITARAALFFRQSAQFREGPGCVLEPWKD